MTYIRQKLASLHFFKDLKFPPKFFKKEKNPQMDQKIARIIAAEKSFMIGTWSEEGKAER